MTRCFDYYRKGKHTIIPAMRAIHQGLTVHGVDCDKRPTDPLTEYDFALCWGGRQDERLRDLGWKGPVLYAEVGYISPAIKQFTTHDEYCAARYSHVSFSWNDWHGQGDDYLPESLPSDRWDALGVEMQPWRLQPDGEIVILGQAKYDIMAIPPGKHHAENENYLHSARKFYGEGVSVRFRPHPHYTGYTSPKLILDCAAARRVITYSSTSAIETVLAGIPTQVVSPYSMAYPMACHDFDEPEITPDREMWANRLAYAQWTLPELESGEFWEYVRRGL
jgi:hypothetical protein